PAPRIRCDGAAHRAGRSGHRGTARSRVNVGSAVFGDGAAPPGRRRAMKRVLNVPINRHIDHVVGPRIASVVGDVLWTVRLWSPRLFHGRSSALRVSWPPAISQPAGLVGPPRPAGSLPAHDRRVPD